MSMSEELHEIFDEDLVDEHVDFDETLLLIENVGHAMRAASNELRATAPGALQGALTGFMVGGPAGAAVGAVAGGVGSRMTTSSTQPPTPVGPAPLSPPPTLNAAGAQLLGALLRPETMQALGALALGGAGAPVVPVAGTPVPVAAFANLLAHLATQAAAQQHATLPASPTVPTYVSAALSPANPAVRAEALLSLLADAESMDDAEEDIDEDIDEDIAGDWMDSLSIERDLADIDRLEAD